MSLAIDPEQVEALLMPDGNWYPCTSFTLDAYEYVDADYDEPGRGKSPGFVYLGGGNERDAGVPALGFRMEVLKGTEKSRQVIAGPITSIVAVREKGGEWI